MFTLDLKTEDTAMNALNGGTQMQWAAITVTYNSESVLDDFMETTRHFENVIVVDNNSADNTVKRLCKELPHAIILQQSNNIGFGPANNIGIKQLDQSIDYVLFLNPDCTISKEDVLKLISTLQARSDAGLVCPIIKTKWNEIRKIKTKNYNMGFTNATTIEDLESLHPSTIIDNGCIDGACFLVDVKKFREIGCFDEKIFMYFEEDDIGFRMATHGLSILINSECTAIHAGGRSTAKSFRIEIRRAYHYRWSKYHLIEKYVHPRARLKKALKDTVISPFKCIWHSVTLDKARATASLGWFLASIDGLLMTRIFRSV